MSEQISVLVVEDEEHIRTVLETAKGMMSDVGQALYAGADDYITKPFDPEELGEIIKKKLQRCSEVKSG